MPASQDKLASKSTLSSVHPSVGLTTEDNSASDDEKHEQEILLAAQQIQQKRKKVLEEEKHAKSAITPPKPILKAQSKPTAKSPATPTPVIYEDSALPPATMDEKVNPFTGRSYSSRYYEILKKRMTLPAWEAREPLIELLKKHQVVVLQGETGSGKTTQMPQFLLRSIFRGYPNLWLTFFLGIRRSPAHSQEEWPR